MLASNPARLPREWVDEIPTAPSRSKAGIVSIAAMMLFGLGAAAWKWGPEGLEAFLFRNPEINSLFSRNNVGEALGFCFNGFGIVGILCAVAGLISLLRSRYSYQLLRVSLITVYLVLAAYVVTTWVGCSAILADQLAIDNLPQDRATILKFWWKVSWPAFAVGAYVLWLQMMMRSRSVYGAFTGEEGTPMRGDRALEDIRTHGRDPRHRRSLYSSATTHIMILVIIPWLLSLRGCVEGYKVPKGSGNPVVAMVKMVKPKKIKKKTLTLRPDSNIITAIPDLDETEVDKEMEKKTEARHEAGALANPGNIGKGGGKEGGWPAGAEDYKFRFIRLEHDGAGWDDGMNETGADKNFLQFFAKATGFKKIARKGESHPVSLLRKYPADEFPPFVYLTGNSDMGRLSDTDRKILREYCLKGGMLIADAGSARFHNSFVNFMRQVFPDKPLLDIADDDMIYQLPARFPEGAPAFWHHGGRRALGVKHDGRWIVFYHPGDMNDAWKSAGYTDVSSDMRDTAMSLGVNLVYYAFNQWDDAVTKLRK